MYISDTDLYLKANKGLTFSLSLSLFFLDIFVWFWCQGDGGLE